MHSIVFNCNFHASNLIALRLVNFNFCTIVIYLNKAIGFVMELIYIHMFIILGEILNLFPNNIFCKLYMVNLRILWF